MKLKFACMEDAIGFLGAATIMSLLLCITAIFMIGSGGSWGLFLGIAVFAVAFAIIIRAVARVSDSYGQLEEEYKKECDL